MRRAEFSLQVCFPRDKAVLLRKFQLAFRQGKPGPVSDPHHSLGTSTREVICLVLEDIWVCLRC